MTAKNTTLDAASVPGGNTVVGIDASGNVLPVSALRLADNSDIATGNPLPTHDALLQTLIAALLPSALVSGRLDVHVGAVTGYTQPVSNSFFDVPFSDLATEITLESVGAQIVSALGAVTITSLPAVTFAAPQHVIVDSATLGTVTVSGAVTTSGTATVSGTVAATQSGTWSLGASSAVIGHVVTDAGSTTAVTSLPALPAGSNAIGSVTVTSAPTTAVTIAALPALAVGSATIGAVTGPSAAPLALDAHLTDGTLRGTVALSAGSAVVGHVITDTGSTTAVTGTVTVAGAVTTSGTVTEASAASIATNTGTTGTNTTTLVARTPALGQALAAASSPVVLTAAQDVVAYAPAKESGGVLASILTKFTDGLQRAGILGKDGSTLSSASNGVAVAPETSSTWNVSDRAARLLGALTGGNGSSIATGANPVPVQLSDGANLTIFPVRYSGTSLIAAGVQLRTGKGVVQAMFWANANVAAIPFMLFDSVGAPGAGAIPIYAVAIAVAGSQTVNTALISFASGLWIAVNTGATVTPTYTAAAGTTSSISYNLCVQ